MEYHYEYSTYNTKVGLRVNPQTYNMDAFKNRNYGLCWSLHF